jgi:hypothetical protein
MNCRRSLEFLSDYIEASLAPPLVRELEIHLGSCDDCRGLEDAMREVVSALASHRASEPPSHLTELVLERSRPVLQAARASTVRPDDRAATPFHHYAPWLAAAAVLAAVVVWRPPEFLSAMTRHVSQTAYQTYSFGVRTYHQTERWIEELNVLRLTVGVAFEDRIDRLNERLRDLDEVRRRTDDGDDSSRSGLPSRGDVARSDHFETRSLL